MCGAQARELSSMEREADEAAKCQCVWSEDAWRQRRCEAGSGMIDMRVAQMRGACTSRQVIASYEVRTHLDPVGIYNVL